MAQSPLTQQSRPNIFEPKIVGLYRQLFREIEDEEKSEGFWRELFLLKPDIPRLCQMLDDADAEYLLHMQHQSQRLLLQAIAQMRAGRTPTVENALDTLTVFFTFVLGKKFTNPSSDIIEILAGLDNVDAVFSELVATLDMVVRDGRATQARQKAVRTTVSVVSGAYQTALVSYFTHRDLFPALMKLIRDLEDPLQSSEPFMLIGLLANYNKFEVHNPYRQRLEDFMNDDTIQRIVASIGVTTSILRNNFVAIQEDLPAAWNLSGTLSYVGLGMLPGVKPAAPVMSEEQTRELFARQPGHEAAILLSIYDFTLANKLICFHFITARSSDKKTAPPFSSFLSLASYLNQHAYRSARASLYAWLVLLIVLILVEDPTTAKHLCDNMALVRLCRQRQPYLPVVQSERTYAAAVVDVLVDGINHNLRKRLDTSLYIQSVTVLIRLLSYLGKSGTKLVYHWAELWRSLLSFVRFLTAYAEELKTLSGTQHLVSMVVELITLALTTGETFLPDSIAYDDLFYKLVESGDALVKFRDAYALAKSADLSSIETLIGVSKHYADLIDERKAKSSNLSPREVSKIIKQGYETLSIEAKEGLDHFEKWREADHKVEMKRVARTAVADARALLV